MRFVLGIAAVVVLLVAGCSTTEQVAVKDQPAVCGFLGEVCKQLTPGQEGEAGAPLGQPQGQPDPVQQGPDQHGRLLRSDKEKVSPKDEQTLTDAFAKALNEELARSTRWWTRLVRA